jgi:hypothetical protein
MSKPTELHLWWITEEFGQRRKTTCRIDRKTAIGCYLDAQPVPNTVEMRNLPESMDERSTGGAPRSLTPTKTGRFR